MTPPPVSPQFCRQTFFFSCALKVTHPFETYRAGGTTSPIGTRDRNIAQDLNTYGITSCGSASSKPAGSSTVLPR